MSKIQSCFNYCDHLVKEVITVSAVTYGLSKTCETLFKDVIYDIEKTNPFRSIVISPVAEEIFFRGVLHKSIELTQRTYSFFRGQELTEETLLSQKIWRTRISAVFFGVLHLPSGVMPAILATIGGFSYGPIAEKTNSIAITILLHATWNGLCVATSLGMIHPVTGVVCLLALFIFDYSVARHGIEPLLASSKERAIVCINVCRTYLPTSNSSLSVI